MKKTFMDEKKAHGGHRPGAGRPKNHRETVRLRITKADNDAVWEHILTLSPDERLSALLRGLDVSPFSQEETPKKDER